MKLPEKTERKFKAVYSGKSRKQAVILFCHECMGYDGHREPKAHVSYISAGYEVMKCENEICPLWKYRK